MFVELAPEYPVVYSILKAFPELMMLEDAFIAGGALRAIHAGEEIKDIDVFFKSEQAFKNAVKRLSDLGYEYVFKTERAITYNSDTVPFQLISAIYGTIEEILLEFDFTIAKTALELRGELTENDVDELISHWLEKSNLNKIKPQEAIEALNPVLIVHQDFFKHLASRRLVFTGSPMPLASLKRAVKFLKRGYHICDEELLNLATALSEIDFENEEEVQQHMEGMDPDGLRRVRLID